MPHEFTAQYHVFRPGPSRVLNFPHESLIENPGPATYPRIGHQPTELCRPASVWLDMILVMDFLKLCHGLLFTEESQARAYNYVYIYVLSCLCSMPVVHRHSDQYGTGAQ